MFIPGFFNFIIGIIIGTGFSFAHYKLVEISIKNAINNHKAQLLSIVLGVSKPIVLALPLGLSVLFPSIINIFGVFAGVIIPKLYLFIDGIRKVKNRR